MSALPSNNRDSMLEWTRKAARGECGWICADCCMSDPRGMPDQCMAGQPGSLCAEQCNAIIKRDKEDAWAAKRVEEVVSGQTQ